MNYLIIFAWFAAFVSIAHGRNLGYHLITRLNEEIDKVNDLVIEVQRYFRSQRERESLDWPTQSYLTKSMAKADDTLGRSLALLEHIQQTYRKHSVRANEGTDGKEEHTSRRNIRRKNENNTDWDIEFYRALAKILHRELRNEEGIEDIPIEKLIVPHDNEN